MKEVVEDPATVCCPFLIYCNEISDVDVNVSEEANMTAFWEAHDDGRI